MQLLPKLDSQKMNGRRNQTKYSSFAQSPVAHLDDLEDHKALNSGRIAKRPDVLTAHRVHRPTTIDSSIGHSAKITARTNASSTNQRYAGYHDSSRMTTAGHSQRKVDVSELNLNLSFERPITYKKF